MNIRRWIALLALFAMVAAACGAPDDGDDDAADDGTESTAADSGGDDGESGDDSGGDDGDAAAGDSEPLLIGVVMPTTGGVAAQGTDFNNGWELYWEQNGASAGGRNIEWIYEDTASDPDTGVQKTTQLVEVEGADIIIPGLLANVGNAIAASLDGNDDVLQVTATSCADDLLQRTPIPNYVRAGGWSCSQTSHVLGEWAANNDYDNVITACNDYAFGHELCGGFSDVFQLNGGSIQDQLWFPLGSQDFSTYVTQIREGDPGAAMVLAVGASGLDWVQQWFDFGLTNDLPVLYGEVTTDQSVLRNMDPDTVLGAISAGHWAEGADLAETKEFVDLYDEAYGDIPSYYAAGGYGSAQWIAETLENSGGEFEPGAFVDTMKTMTVNTPFGPQSLDDTGNPVFTVYIREVVMRDDGRLWNVVIDQVDNVDQYYPRTKEEYLEQPIYSRDFQG
ncbi:MAG: ABC transporter substrate-binding protein [Acidimicrobiales bacterium]